MNVYNRGISLFNMNKLFKIVISFLVFGLSVSLQGQEIIVFGNITDLKSGNPIDFVTIHIEGTNIATESDINGDYRISIPNEKTHAIIFSRIGYHDARSTIPAMKFGSKRYINIQLSPKTADIDIVVTESRIEDIGMVREEVGELLKLPSASGNLESVLPSIALGTTSGTGGELSSQYNVRGGNYDENLVYVNDFEIFRPQLIRTGQQEGLSFPNIDLVRDLSFSSGGFESKYGDKLSSVLDIKYKRPDKSKGSVGLSLLGTTAHLEGSKRIGANAYNKFRYLIGARYKTTKYILGSLDTKGEYLPDFTDVQAYLTYDITRVFQIGLLGNFNNSTYNFTPTERSTTLGLITQALRFTSVFEGSETDKFTNGTAGLSLTYVPERLKNPMYLKFLASHYRSSEEENFDILGYYRLAEIETSLGSDDFGEEINVLGIGTQHSYTRNYLFNLISSYAHKGGVEIGINDSEENSASHFLQWGVNLQTESFDDRINEWERLDSAGFSIPVSPSSLQLENVLKTTNKFSNFKYSAYVQNSYNKYLHEKFELKFTTGIRTSYRTQNKEILLSPRFQILYKPLSWNKDIAFKLSGGVYHQQPFYRELRRPDGTLNLDLKSQKSIHFVTGIAYDFDWKRMSENPFKLIAEIYYKKLSNLVSYEIDNVRIRYSGENDSEGYVAGLDLRINGEFVPGAESWINFSLLTAKENILNVQHLSIDSEKPQESLPISYVPRPTDQFFTMAMFFQDYLPNNENFKMFLNITLGTGLPFGVKDDNLIYRNNFRYKPYHRVDIGFGYQLWRNSWKNQKPRHPLRFTENAWLSLEVFNLLEVANVANNTWIKTITNSQFAIPNYLTSRRINLRLKIDF